MKLPVSTFTFAALTAAVLATPAPADDADTSPELHAERFVSERWNFRIVQEGGPEGRAVVDFFAQEDAAWVHDISTLGSDVHEDLSMVFDPGTLAWRSAIVSGEFSGMHVHASYDVESDRVRGVFAQHRLSDGRRAERPIDEPMPAGGLARGAAIWLAHTMTWEEGTEYRFPWFAFLGARFEEVTLRRTGSETVTVPAGSFEAHRIEQIGGTPGNILWVTTAPPHRTVRVDIVGQPMTIELESIEAHSTPEA